MYIRYGFVCLRFPIAYFVFKWSIFPKGNSDPCLKYGNIYRSIWLIFFWVHSQKTNMDPRNHALKLKHACFLLTTKLFLFL